MNCWWYGGMLSPPLLLADIFEIMTNPTRCWPFFPQSNRWLFIVILALLPALSAGANELANNPSPYLAMHGHDPVNWRAWGPEVLKQAKRENKLLFVSIGYFACRWCHVMQRESYQDREVAAVLNRHFIAVKVDRELNPVLDERLIEFVQATAGRAGWPLNVFLTPEGYPVVGMTYVPRDRFVQVLNELQKRWKRERKQLTEAARDVDDMLAVATEADNRPVEKPLSALYPQVIDEALQLADRLQGGFGQQMKFPMAPQLAALLQWLEKNDNPELKEFLGVTLDAMSRRGLFDHVGGGFFRYTVDPSWSTPHYEKMLYTSAMLAPIYLRAARQLDKPGYRQVALRTLDFMLDELAAPGGGYIASLSAVDDQGREGGYYLWSQADLQKLFSGKDLDFVNAVWDMLREPAPALGNLPIEDFDRAHIEDVFDLDDAGLEKKLREIRQRLKREREAHRHAPRDDKRLAGWNGMALAAFAEAADAGERYRRAGQALARFIGKTFWRGGDLVKAVDRQGRPLGPAVLFDYAAVADGLSAWAEKTGDRHARQLAGQIVRRAWKLFHADNGWRQNAEDLLPHPLRQRHIRDSALPSPEALLLRATRRVLDNADDPALAKALASVTGVSSKGSEAEPFYHASLISAADTIE